MAAIDVTEALMAAVTPAAGLMVTVLVALEPGLGLIVIGNVSLGP